MARIIYSGIVTEIRGSVGGTTFQKNKYGFKVKNKPNMVKPATHNQDLQKRYLLELVQTWQAMTNTQRSDWSSYASTYPQYSKNNPTSQLDGYAVFLHWNMQNKISGAFVQTNPGGAPAALSPYTFQLFNTGPTLEYLIIPDASTVNLTFNAFISFSVPPSLHFGGTRTRYMVSDSFEINGGDISAQYLAQFGQFPNTGDKVFVRLVFFGTFDAFVYAHQIIEVIIS